MVLRSYRSLSRPDDIRALQCSAEPQGTGAGHAGEREDTESLYRGGKVQPVALPGVTVDLDALFA